MTKGDLARRWSKDIRFLYFSKDPERGIAAFESSALPKLLATFIAP